ncbi:MAG: hypothetical protein ACI935_003343, partial [Moritella dasanensis]
SNVPVGSKFSIDGGTTVLTVTNSSTGVDINLADLGNVQFMPPAQYSGTISIHMKVKTTDTDEDSTLVGDTEISSTDTLVLEIDPIADNVTLAIKQAIGSEDAGRSFGNTGNNVSAGDIDNATDGIALNIITSSDDTDGSEYFVVTISDIPGGGSLYYNGTLINNNSGSSNGDLVATNAAGDTWQLKINDFDNDAVLTFVPPHNSDDNYTLKVSAYSVDGADNTLANSQQLDISVDVKGVADIPFNTEVNTASNDGNTYQVVSNEASLDNNNNQVDLQDIYQSPSTLSSYDNDGSETLTVILTNLDSQFNIVGASFSGGTGTARQWVFLAEDLANIKISSPANFSGEIDFTLSYVTTENEGNSKTHANENISILITPDSEAGLNSSTNIGEDQLTLLDFTIKHENNDTDESIDSISLNKSDLSAGDFTLYYGNSSAIELDDAVISNSNITDTGSHYVFTNGSYENIYALGDADLHSHNSFEVIYGIKDSAPITGGTVDDIKETSINYELTVNPITDDIDLSLTSLNHTGNASVLDNTVTVTSNTTISVELDINGINDTNEANGADIDGSEQITHLLIENVDNGISVVNALYAGDVYNSITGSFEHSGTWYLPINETLDSDGVNRTVDFRIISDDLNLQTSNIKITAYNEDNGNETFTDDSQLIIIEKDADYSGSIELGTPADITDFSVNSIELREDDSFTLDQIIDATIEGSGKYSISFAELPDGSTVTGATENGNAWYISGTGDSATILAKMQAVTITLPANFNSFDNADSDTFTITAKLTTYDNFSQNTAELSLEQPVYPLTDALTIAVTQTGTTDENIPHAFSLNLSNDADGINNTIIDGNLYIKVEENYKDVDESALGTLTDGNGDSLTIVTDPIGLSGNYYLVSGVNTTDELDFIFTPGSGRYGDVMVDVYVQNQETDGWESTHPDGDTAIELSHQNFEFTVKNVIDVVEFPQGGGTGGGGTGGGDTGGGGTGGGGTGGGGTGGGGTGGGGTGGGGTGSGGTGGGGTGSGTNESPVNDVIGEEDAVVAGGSNWVALDLTANVIDPSDPLLSTLLDNVPDGFLVYYQDPTNPGTYKLALNTGISNDFGSAYNQWLIPLDNGALQENIYIQAPEHWSGTIADIKFKTISQGNTPTDLAESSTSFDVTINAVADNITLNATKTFGDEGDDIAINLNANIEDLDGSETVTLTLLNLGENANFKVNGADIDDSNISYNSGDGGYTITNIAVDDINNLTFTQESFSGTVNVTAKMVETSNGNSSTLVNTSFEAIISAVNPTTADDTLFYKTGNDIDALNGNDTLILANDLGIDFTGLTDDIDNIEQFDLTQNGNHQLDNLSLADVVTMTDSDNELIILGDSGDSINFTNDDNWEKGATTTENGHIYDLYTTGDDPTVVVKVEQLIDDNILP